MANSKRKNVDNLVRKEVATFLLDNPDYTGSDLKKKVEKSLKRKGLHYNFSERTYQNIKSEISPNLDDAALDRPWDMGSLNDNPIPLESIAILLSLQNSKRSEGQLMITVREAKWLSRLYSLGQFVGTGSDRLQSVNTMVTWAQAYALREKVCKVVGIDCDTSDLDQNLSGDFNLALEKWEWRILVNAIEGHLIKDEQTLRTTVYTLETMLLEIEFLRYSLGKPDLDLDSWDIYVQILHCLPDSVKSTLRAVTPEQAKQFFISLREWVKQNPEWVKQHPRADELSDHIRESMEKDCAQVASKIVSSIKKSKGKKVVVKESISISQLSIQVGEEFRRLHGMVDKERKDDERSA